MSPIPYMYVDSSDRLRIALPPIESTARPPEAAGSHAEISLRSLP